MFKLTFNKIELALAKKGAWNGSKDTLVSLTIEDDFSYLQSYLSEYSECVQNYVYLLFQTFSGDELHIVSKEVIAEIIL